MQQHLAHGLEWHEHQMFDQAAMGQGLRHSHNTQIHYQHHDPTLVAGHQVSSLFSLTCFLLITMFCKSWNDVINSFSKFNEILTTQKVCSVKKNTYSFNI